MIDSWIASFCDLSWFQLTMDATRLRRPERTQELVLLWFNTHLVAAFLLNISVFLTAVGLFFSLSGNYAGALAGVAVAMLTSLVGGRTLARDESVRMFGFVIAVGGLLAVAAILVSPQFFQVGLFESPTWFCRRSCSFQPGAA